MKKNKLNINPSPLTPEDINAGKNFDSFHQQFQAQHKGPSLLRKLALPGLAVAAAITIAIVMFRMPNNNIKTIADFVSPPIEGLERSYEAMTFLVDKGLSITMPSGTVINVPANAFLDEFGNPYTGEATLKYREYTDPVAIALSGIPMNYDSAGVSFTFESAGMFDLVVETNPTGTTAPKALSLANGTVVSVGMPATSTDTDFNVYELDTASRNWALRGQDSIAPLAVDTIVAPAPAALATTAPKKKVAEVSDPQLEEMFKTLQSIGDSINYYKNIALTKPVKTSPEGHRFDLDNKVNEFPELVFNELLTWEVAPFTPNFEPAYLGVRWTTAKVTRVSGSNYNINLKRDDVDLNFPVKPVYHGKNYETAVKKYNGKLIENENRLVYLQSKQQEWQTKYNGYKASLQASKGSKSTQELNKQEKQYLDEYNLATASNAMYRFVAVTNMGIWNIDRVMKDEYVMAETEFKDSKGEILTMHRMFLFEKGINGTLEFFKMPDNHIVRFKYNPERGYSGLGITKEGKAFLIRPSDIKQIKTDGINTITAKEFFIPKSEQDLRERLKGAA